MTLAIGILVSNRGSNLEAILNAIDSNYIRNAEVKVVISNRDGIQALKIAEEHQVKKVVIDRQPEFNDKKEYDKKILEVLEQNDVRKNEGLVLLAGYDMILSHQFCREFDGRIMNVHPTLLPSFKGRDGQRQALEYGVKISGASVHFVVPKIDSGPIIIQEAVPVLNNDTVKSLAARILAKEHEIYPEAVRLFAEGRIHIENERVKILN